MTTLPRRLWREMTTKEFAALDARRVIAVLPVGSIEQHGPHLPVGVDGTINETILGRALELLPPELPVTVLPMTCVGKSDEHLAFPGTLTHSAETLIRVWTEIGESVARAGVRKLVIFNSHGGQPQLVDVVARELRIRCGMFVVAASTYRLGRPPGLFPEAELKHGIHAGSVETSVMLHARPDLVHRAEARNFETLSQRMEREFRLLTPEGAIGFGWQTQDLNPDGACGNALDADPERGRLVVEHAARVFVELLAEVDRFPLENLKERA
ncbi:MAG TPA: creatininase family protein [Methylomirabilota bacterium]|jgi:creatinine amidohydrolase|nr:creatininase family protein [Methylomirabilota bacterium]